MQSGGKSRICTYIQMHTQGGQEKERVGEREKKMKRNGMERENRRGRKGKNEEVKKDG